MEKTMRHGIVAVLAGMVLLMAPGVALAGHGKVGLWRVTSSTKLSMATSPEAAKAAPASSHTTHMCMSQEEVESDAPPHIDSPATGCDTRLTGHTATGMTAELICNGGMKGKGHMQIAYDGAEHYTGSYSFKGTVEGNPANLDTSFKGDWIKADCGKVRPYKLRTQ
jgi:hypothetical protein